MQYAVINFTKQTTQFYATEADASQALIDLDVANDLVFVASIPDLALEQI
jgi:hypothetical protein